MFFYPSRLLLKMLLASSLLIVVSNRVDDFNSTCYLKIDGTNSREAKVYLDKLTLGIMSTK
jgi:hypothetical protein